MGASYGRLDLGEAAGANCDHLFNLQYDYKAGAASHIFLYIYNVLNEKLLRQGEGVWK